MMDQAFSWQALLGPGSLIKHIIEESSQTEIVKKQLASPTVDVFSNVKFGEEGNDISEKLFYENPVRILQGE